MNAVLTAWRANKRRWDPSVLLALPPKTRVFEDGVGVKRTSAGLSWFIYYRAPKAPGSRATKTVHEPLMHVYNKTQAMAELSDRKGKLQTGNYKRQERKLEITLDQLGDMFVTARRHLRSEGRYREIIDLHVLPFFGKHTLARAVTREQVEEFYATKLDDGCAIASCNYYLTTIRAMMGLAFERDFIDSNPARKVKTKKANNRRERMLTEDEANALVRAAEARADYLRPFFIVLLGTGMRLSEATTLAWSHVDLERRLIRLVKTKNDQGRWVPLAANVHAELERWRKVIPGEPFVFPGREPGTHIKEVKKGWAALCAEAGVKVTRHELRHNFVSQALAHGHSAADIMPITGHTTMRAFEGYAHTLASRKRAVMEGVLPSTLRQRLPGDCPSENEASPERNQGEQVSDLNGEALAPTPGLEPGTRGLTVRRHNDK